VLILTGIAVCGILFVRQKIAQENSSAQTPDESIHRRLEDLTVLMEKIRSQENSGSADPELKRIMEETERLINDARTMLLSEKTENRPEDVDPQMLH
jgi:hypothetical protein